MRNWWCVMEKKKQKMVLLFVTFTLMLHFQMKGCVGCVESERVGLLELKWYLTSLLGHNTDLILKSWSYDDPTSDCCIWERVKCRDGHIIELSLGEVRSDYNMPQSLNLSLFHSFPQLQSLNFSWNDFDNLFDPIHGYKSFQRLEKLRTLDFSGNDLNNSVLPFLSAAKSLRTLNLRFINLESVFPPQGYKSFQRLEKLRTLDLSINHLNNSVLPFLSAAKSLRTLNLGGNELKGAFPPEELANMTKLKVLDLSYNGFSLFSAQGLVNLRELEELDLSENAIGSIQAGLVFPLSLQVLKLRGNRLSLTPKGYSEICRLMNLRELDLRGNALTSMSYCLGNLTRLRILELSHNQLDGDMSLFVSNLPSTLEYLSLIHNNFNGSFSFNSLANHTKLTVFKMSSYSGMIQPMARSSWIPLFQLKILMLQNFILGSTIPGILVHQRELRFVDLSNNNLTGTFPAWLVQNNTRLHMLLLNSNSLSKFQLPRLAHGLEVLDISSNKISDSLQEDIGIVFSNLRYMNFSSNHFQGGIPSSMGEMERLDTLDMSSNGLSGKLPTTVLSGCYSLRILKLSNNKLHGEIFPEHANLTSLGWLALGGNTFNGSLGKGLLNSENLTVLDVSNNRISGVLPLWICRLSNLIYLNMRRNQLKGPFHLQLQELYKLEVLDISHNSLSGSLPKKNFDPLFLRELRLQSNEFDGTIPDTIFKGDSLEVLDLGNNNFSGKIPNSIGEYTRLRVLLLGNNGLQSHIPKNICQFSYVNLLDLSHNKLEGVLPSCFSNMSFGANGPGGVAGTSSDDPFLTNWKYTSALDLEDFVVNFDDPKNVFGSQPIIGVEFTIKSRYETYQGDISLYLYGLDLSSNQLSGDIPVELGNLHNILSLNLSNNNFTGSIPDSFSNLKAIESLDLSNNELCGRIPPQLANLNNIGFFNVSWNNLSGEIPIKGHLLTFDEKSYIGNAHLCGRPTNISCNPTKTLEQSATDEEELSDGAIDMEWFYWTCGAVYISTALASFVFLSIDTRWSRKCLYRVDLMVHHLHRFKGRFICN